MYTGLLLSGKLNDHLHGMDERASNQDEQIVAAMAKKGGTDEMLKAREQFRWVGLMNNYRNCAEKIMLKEIVYE